MPRAYLRRYMELRHAIQLLETGKLAFLDPASWDDTNDSHFLMAYKESRQLRTLLAVCFTQVSERHHHWERFSARGTGRPSKAGAAEIADREPICIEFERDKLLESLRGKTVLSSDVIKYRRLTALEKRPPPVEDWPFVKRFPYKDESEFRVIYASQRRQEVPVFLPIDLKSVRTVIVGPYVETRRREEIVARLRGLRHPWGSFKVNKTTILDNRRWKKIVDRAKEAASGS